MKAAGQALLHPDQPVTGRSQVGEGMKGLSMCSASSLVLHGLLSPSGEKNSNEPGIIPSITIWPSKKSKNTKNLSDPCGVSSFCPQSARRRMILHISGDLVSKCPSAPSSMSSPFLQAPSPPPQCVSPDSRESQ